ncbi:MAG: methyltransferase [Bacteroidetes bacterium]|nr:methyltransferase [Bacteroidota bacterium]
MGEKLKSEIFKFKQFDVDQTGCAMKINTDGVLLGALADADHPKTILDIGTGTGVIALMLAQRFSGSRIDAVEIDNEAAETARRNFESSPFSERLTALPFCFEEFFEKYPERQYDLIVSNPPFYINSLKSPQKGRRVAKHADKDFFENLVKRASAHLARNGLVTLILPVDTAELVIKLSERYGLFPVKRVNTRSFFDSEPHRVILFLGSNRNGLEQTSFVIYKSPGVYSEVYIKLLQPYFIAF